MGILDPTEACFVVDDDLLNFTFGGDDEEDEDSNTLFKFKGSASASSSSLESSNPAPNIKHGASFPEVVEEELEWLLDKDAFPAVETCFGILSDNPELVANHLSPVSVLENSSSSSNNSNINSNNGSGSSVASCCGSFKVPINHPVGVRSKKRRRRTNFGELPSQHFMRLSQVNVKNKQESLPTLPPTNSGASMGRRCFHCQADKTPQWRAGPMGPKTLCNACGVRYKSGRLLPEYRPASSPTFSNVLHSNSHRKVVEMRRQNQLSMGGGIAMNEACGYSVG